MIYPLIADVADEGIPVVLSCRVLVQQADVQVARQTGLTAGLGRRVPGQLAVDIHHDDPEVGYRFITDELAVSCIKASRNRVNRLCTAQRIRSVHSRKRGLNRRPRPPVHDDLVERQFTAERPNELWLTDGAGGLDRPLVVAVGPHVADDGIRVWPGRCPS